MKKILFLSLCVAGAIHGLLAAEYPVASAAQITAWWVILGPSTNPVAPTI